MVLNLNEHEQINQLVRESPGLLSGIIGSAMDAIIAIDDAQRIVLFNSAAERIFLCRAIEAIGGSIERFIPERFRAEHSVHIRRFAESGVTNRTLYGLGTLWGLRTTGEEFPIEASISKVESAGKKFFTVVIRDITERIRSEEALRKSEERFRLAAQAGRMFAYEWDAATDLITRSPESAHILGISEAVPITGQQVLAKVHPDDLEMLKDAIAALSPDKPYLHVSYRMIRPDNTVIWVQRTSCAHFDEQEKPLRIIGMVADITERHRSEEAVRESEQRFRLVADTAPVMIWVSGADKLCTYFNKPWLDFTGRSREEELGNGWTEGVHPDDLQRCLQTYTQFFDRREKFKMEYRLRHHDGEYRWILDIGVPRFNQDRVFAGYIGIGVDVTERKLAEEALRKSEERFRLAARSGKMFAYEWDVATDIIVRSGDITTVLGTAAEASLTRQQLLATIYPDDRALFNASVSERTPEHPDVHISYRMLRPDGSIIWLEKTAHALFDEQGRMVRMIGMVGDIRERKQAENKLREYERAVEASGEMITVIDREYRCVMANRQYLKLRNLNKEQVLGHFAYELVDEKIFEDVIKPKLDECFQGNAVKYELKYTYPELGERILFISYFPIEGPNGIDRVTCLIQDITAHKKAEQALSEMTRKLIEAQEQERTRIGRELHDDINQRLAMLGVELEQLGENHSEVQSRVQEIRKELRQLSDDVQALSHNLHSSKLEYLGVVAGMKSWCKEFAERQKMDIQFRSDVGRVLPLDVGLSLFRVLQEALQNASKHSGVKQIKVQLREESSEIQLIVNDSGRGFDVESALRGKGLGLTSMRERIRLINGTLTIDSRPMHGTTIHVRVPLEPKHVSQRAAV